MTKREAAVVRAKRLVLSAYPLAFGWREVLRVELTRRMG